MKQKENTNDIYSNWHKYLTDSEKTFKDVLYEIESLSTSCCNVNFRNLPYIKENNINDLDFLKFDIEGPTFMQGIIEYDSIDLKIPRSSDFSVLASNFIKSFNSELKNKIHFYEKKLKQIEKFNSKQFYEKTGFSIEDYNKTDYLNDLISETNHLIKSYQSFSSDAKTRLNAYYLEHKADLKIEPILKNKFLPKKEKKLLLKESNGPDLPF